VRPTWVTHRAEAAGLSSEIDGGTEAAMQRLPVPIAEYGKCGSPGAGVPGVKYPPAEPRGFGVW
jgi:hypothetical protein